MFGFLPGPALCCSRAATMYRAHFCGLSSCLNREYGMWARCLVNRDSTFLALLGTALAEQDPALTDMTCCNPLGKKRLMLGSGFTLQYSAAITLCGLSTKLEDDALDERGPRRWLAMAGREMLESAYRKALGQLHALQFQVESGIALLRAQEQQELLHTDLVSAAQPTSAAYGAIVAHLATLCRLPTASEALHEVGRQLGFLIYTQDAWEDWASDRKHGRFNPLHHLEDENARRKTVVPLMQQAADRLRAAFASLPVLRHRELLQQVLVEGADSRVLAVAQGRENKPARRRNPARESRCCGKCDSWNPVDCCDCVRCFKPSSKPSMCDCNPCDGDGCGCCGCDCDCGC